MPDKTETVTVTISKPAWAIVKELLIRCASCHVELSFPEVWVPESGLMISNVCPVCLGRVY